MAWAPKAVYILCALTSLAAAVMLLRGYARSRVRLLMWAGLCFAGLVANNVVLYVDLVHLPDHDLLLWRNAAALAAMGCMIVGLVWDEA
jgi:hypothetical protein